MPACALNHDALKGTLLAFFRPLTSSSAAPGALVLRDGFQPRDVAPHLAHAAESILQLARCRGWKRRLNCSFFSFEHLVDPILVDTINRSDVGGFHVTSTR